MRLCSPCCSFRLSMGYPSTRWYSPSCSFRLPIGCLSTRLRPRSSCILSPIWKCLTKLLFNICLFPLYLRLRLDVLLPVLDLNLARVVLDLFLDLCSCNMLFSSRNSSFWRVKFARSSYSLFLSSSNLCLRSSFVMFSSLSAHGPSSRVLSSSSSTVSVSFVWTVISL